MTTANIMFLCTERELDRERAGMWEALQACATVHVMPRWLESVDEILAAWREAAPARGLPVLLWPDPHAAYLPTGLARSSVQTACWHIDSFSVPEWRAEHARLFDVTFVFHPQSVARFRELGVDDVHLLPHSVRGACFGGDGPERATDVAFIGSLKGAYDYRRACLTALAGDGHSMNDYLRSYDYAGLATTYRSARVGVNIPQDGYLADANLRCFEVMASGALLLTPAGSELREFGFVPGREYLEFGSVDELRGLVRRMLAAEPERAAIAGEARRKVLAEFTYEQAAARMLAALDRRVRARVSDVEEHRIGLRYFARRGRVAPAAHRFGKLAATGTLTPGDAGHLIAGLARAARARLRTVTP